MFGLLFIIFIAIYAVFILPILEERQEKREEKPEENIQIKKLWSIVQDSMKNQHDLRAEKALLAILSFDEKNAAAYNRLGILYTRQQKHDDAKKCFEIAQSLDKNPALLHNTGLIYLELGEYEKAGMAFRQALELEGDLPARFIALAKAEEKLGKLDSAIEALESAFELDHSVSTLRQILAIHELRGDEGAMAETTARIESQMVKNSKIRDAKLVSVSKKFSEFKRGLMGSETKPTPNSIKDAPKISRTKVMNTTKTTGIKTAKTVKRIRKKLIQ